MSVNNKVDLKDIKQGDIFSEISHYIFNGGKAGNNEFTHIESGETVVLTDQYVQNLLSTADQYYETKEVGKEDKKDGTLGIRSIFEGIHSSQVFAVAFRKQDSPLSKTALAKAQEAQITEALDAIEKAKTAKKGVANAAKAAIEKVQQNPILPYTPGDLRVLRGYKIQFSSRDGRYDCVDMDLVDKANPTKTDQAIRPVNINTIEWLVFKGVKYIVK